MSLLKLHLGRSYLWLFALYTALFLGGFCLAEAAGSPQWGAVTMPIFMALLLLAELRSGVALDSWWFARYPRGHALYRALVLYHALGVVLFCVMAWVFVQ